MQIINSLSGLKAVILQLENQRAAEKEVMKADFHLAYESVKPINLIKSTFREVMESQDLSANIISTAAGLTAGYLSKTLYVSVSKNRFKRLFGIVLMYGITNLVAKHPVTVKSVGGGIFNLIRTLLRRGTHDAEKIEAGKTISLM